MSSEKKSPPTIVPKVVPPRPDEVTSTATRPPASNGTARPAGGGTTNGAQPGVSTPVPPPPPATGASPSGGTAVSGEPVPPPPPSAGATARSGALKAAAAAMATAKAAAKKLAEPAPASTPTKQSEKSSDEIDDRTVPRVTTNSTSTGKPSVGETREVPAMHYTAAGFSGSASPVTAGTPASAAPGQAHPETGATSGARAADGPRRVRLAISRVDPWSVMKLSFLLAVAIGIMTVVATAVLWTVLDGMGVFTETDALIRSIVGEESKVDVLQLVEFNRVVALSTLIAIVNMVLITALSTIMAFIYNIVAAMVGGIHLTLTDD